MSYKTETEAWDEDTKAIKEIEQVLNDGKVTEENFFELYSKIDNVCGRTSLSSETKYIERLRHCNNLRMRILREKK